MKTNRLLQCWNFYSALRVLTNVKRSQNGETQIICYTVATSILLVRMSHRAGPAVSGSSEVSLLQALALSVACLTVYSFNELE